jgi:hypothetical protein
LAVIGVVASSVLHSFSQTSFGLN